MQFPHSGNLFIFPFLSFLFILSYFLLSAHQTEPRRGFLLWWEAWVRIWKWAFLSRVQAMKNKMYTYRVQTKQCKHLMEKSLGSEVINHNNNYCCRGGLQQLECQWAAFFSCERRLAISALTRVFKAPQLTELQRAGVINCRNIFSMLRRTVSKISMKYDWHRGTVRVKMIMICGKYR